MNPSELKFCYIDTNSNYYKQAVKLRYEVFYEPSGVGLEGVYDAVENASIHLVAVMADKVVGYLRLTVKGDRGQLSQFVVDESKRGQIAISRGLVERLVTKAKELSVHEIWGEIRLHVAKTAKLYGFEVSDEVFASKKTGIPHRRIKMII
ncbi:GNAT family N-acetyltransferase [Clostridium akagii]|uniref:GNAT family N-acetyltransferase n=1 Tax=Clostridium akagii TaxID=91623 RepID=UPI00047AB485|nr:GNAT family N-acetyltransferase [Clostridium akagii]